MFQSTHPHGVRLGTFLQINVSIGVSIHAPARGATMNAAIGTLNTEFQSTHPHGVRHMEEVEEV